MKNIFKANLNSFLNDKAVENIPLKNVSVLSYLINEDDLFDNMYNHFKKEFNSLFEINDLYMKSEDFMYRLNLLVNDYIIPRYGNINNHDIKEKVKELVNRNIDLYSSVSYDDTDILIIEDFYDIDNGKEFGIWQTATMILKDM